MVMRLPESADLCDSAQCLYRVCLERRQTLRLGMPQKSAVRKLAKSSGVKSAGVSWFKILKGTTDTDRIDLPGLPCSFSVHVFTVQHANDSPTGAASLHRSRAGGSHSSGLPQVPLVASCVVAVASFQGGAFVLVDRVGHGLREGDRAGDASSTDRTRLRQRGGKLDVVREWAPTCCGI